MLKTIVLYSDTDDDDNSEDNTCSSDTILNKKVYQTTTKINEIGLEVSFEIIVESIKKYPNDMNQRVNYIFENDTSQIN